MGCCSILPFLCFLVKEITKLRTGYKNPFKVSLRVTWASKDAIDPASWSHFTEKVDTIRVFPSPQHVVVLATRANGTFTLETVDILDTPTATDVAAKLALFLFPKGYGNGVRRVQKTQDPKLYAVTFSTRETYSVGLKWADQTHNVRNLPPQEEWQDFQLEARFISVFLVGLKTCKKKLFSLESGILQ